MKKLLLPLCAVLVFTACQKEIATDKTQEEIAGVVANKQSKVTVCHYDAVTKTSKTIEVPQNALAGHLSHGDLEGDCSVVLTTICDQDWMVRNLDVTTYRNGDPIPQVTDLSTWHELTTGAWCYYNNDPANGAIYGKLYNWFAVNDPRGLAPVGWHVPTHLEWAILGPCLNYNGGTMKETGTAHWLHPNEGATNSSGFTGLPGGWLYDWETGSGFQTIGLAGIWWSSTVCGTNYAFYWFLRYDHSYFNWFCEKNQAGLSVRCVRD